MGESPCGRGYALDGSDTYGVDSVKREKEGIVGLGCVNLGRHINDIINGVSKFANLVFTVIRCKETEMHSSIEFSTLGEREGVNT